MVLPFKPVPVVCDCDWWYATNNQVTRQLVPVVRDNGRFLPETRDEFLCLQRNLPSGRLRCSVFFLESHFHPAPPPRPAVSA